MSKNNFPVPEVAGWRDPFTSREDPGTASIRFNRHPNLLSPPVVKPMFYVSKTEGSRRVPGGGISFEHDRPGGGVTVSRCRMVLPSQGRKNPGGPSYPRISLAYNVFRHHLLSSIFFVILGRILNSGRGHSILVLQLLRLGRGIDDVPKHREEAEDL